MSVIRWPWRKRDPETRQLETLRESLGKAPPELSIDEVFPVLVPASFFSLGNWPGPFELLQIPGLGLTWAVFQPQQTMRYVDRDIQVYWESRGIKWRATAMANLRRRSDDRLWTHEFRSDGGELFAVAMMHEDGIGPSRLLLHQRLEALLPEGYVVAVPERSCALVLSARATEAEQAKIHGVAVTCYQNGTAPVLEGFHPPGGLKGLGS
jgi:hypothetical protein